MLIKLKDIEPFLFDHNTEEIERLMESMRSNGLFHAIIVTGNIPYKLVTGRARTLAAMKLQWEEIEATILPEGTSNPQEIALHENLRRHNLQWYDSVELEKQLHELRVKERGAGPKGRRFQDPALNGWSMADTAKELGIARGTFSEDMQLADALRLNPSLRKVKDKMTALKLVKEQIKRDYAEVEALAPSEGLMDQILLGDSLEILKNFPANTFDSCITDPPWSEYKDESLTSPVADLLPIFKEVYRTLKNDTFLHLITSSTDFPVYHSELQKLGFNVQGYPLIWQKTKTITHGRKSWMYARDYEPILVAVKGSPALAFHEEISSILKFDNLHYTKMIHPHEKPIELLQEIIKNCTFTGAKILDPFSGSGVTLEAARSLERHYIGIEKDKKFFENIQRRMSK